jgi:hypothetical protein
MSIASAVRHATIASRAALAVFDDSAPVIYPSPCRADDSLGAPYHKDFSVEGRQLMGRIRPRTKAAKKRQLRNKEEKRTKKYGKIGKMILGK